MKNRLLLCCALLNATLTLPMEVLPPRKSSWNALPADVQRYLTPFIAQSNVIAVANTIRSLNKTNKIFNSFINKNGGMITILEQMPYTANALDLIDLLRKTKLEVVKNREVTTWYEAAKNRLEDGQDLIDAVENQDIQRVEELLRNKNIHLNARSYLGTTALEVAAEGSSKILILLLKAGANPNFQIRNERNQVINGNTPLMTASAAGKIKNVGILLKAGADPFLTDDRGHTAAEIARKHRFPKIAKLLDEASVQKRQQ